jgi:hypothetical protein
MTIAISAALKAHLAQPYQTTATLWLVTLRNGTVLGFTDHDVDIVYPPTDGTTFVAKEGYVKTDIATSAALNVDNLEIDGVLASPSITEADLRAGVWDFAKVMISLVNYADLTQGQMIYRVGTLGKVTLERNSFKAELRGITQAYTRVIGRLVGPSCTTTLGSSKCTVNMTPFTVTGTLAGVAADNRTCYDPARTEPGPSTGTPIVGITRANPGVVTLGSAPDPALTNGQAITIYAVVGMQEVNTTTVAINPSGTTITLPDDTTNFEAYVSGGFVQPLGSGSGYFDNGVITFDSGLNSGLSMEVISYVPGQWVLALPMPYALAAGDAYTMKAGCDYSLATCKNRFDNVVNFRGFPYVPGIDKIMQVGKQP